MVTHVLMARWRRDVWDEHSHACMRIHVLMETERRKEG